jgi:hypothetical protein
MNRNTFLFLLMVPFSVVSQPETEIIENDGNNSGIDSARSGDPEYTTAQLQQKLAGYTRMHNTGKSLLGAGIASTSLGIVSLVGGLSMLVNNDPSGLVLYYIGAIGVGFGPEMLIAGAVLNKIGSTKQREYEKRLHVQIGLNSIFFTCAF